MAAKRLLIATLLCLLPGAALAQDDRYWDGIHFRARLKRIEEGRFGRH